MIIKDQKLKFVLHHSFRILFAGLVLFAIILVFRLLTLGVLAIGLYSEKSTLLLTMEILETIHLIEMVTVIGYFTLDFLVRLGILVIGDWIRVFKK